MNSVQLRPIVAGEIKLGEPLPFPVYEQGGALLLRQGFVVHTQRQIDRLLEGGACAGPPSTPASMPRAAASASGPVMGSSARLAAEARKRDDERATFEVLELAKLRLGRLFSSYRTARKVEGFAARVEDLAVTVQEACTHDTDSALANLHMDYDSPYAVVHQMQAAIICELVGKRLGVGDASRTQLVCAALTHDIGLLDIQDQLDRQTAPLTEEQRGRIAQHPLDGNRFLHALGVRDPCWLDAVHHHHERIDGSGYPDALQGDQLKIPARILAVADMYSAMVRDRPYRKAMVSRTAMRQLMTEQGDKVDARFTQVLIKELGVFPPGAIVRLVNGEVAVVWKRQGNPIAPVVYAFIRPDGMPVLTPRKRFTESPEFAIEGMLPFSGFRGSIAILRGLWIAH